MSVCRPLRLRESAVPAAAQSLQKRTKSSADAQLPHLVSSWRCGWAERGNYRDNQSIVALIEMWSEPSLIRNTRQEGLCPAGEKSWCQCPATWCPFRRTGHNRERKRRERDSPDFFQSGNFAGKRETDLISDGQMSSLKSVILLSLKSLCTV